MLTKPCFCLKKPLHLIKTKQGQNIADIHHQMHQQFFPQAKRFDASDWLFQFGRAKDYYMAYLSIFLAHAVLFEDFHGGESGKKLDSFTDKVFEPAYQELIDLFGIKPLIIKMPWLPEFKHYPGDQNWQEHQIIPEEYYINDI